jgi:N-acetylneuraminic acid mutarotase
MDVPNGRAQASALTMGNLLYVIGGLSDGNDFHTATDSVITCSPGSGGVWTKSKPLPNPLALASAVSINHKIYLFGGMGPRGGDLVDYADASCFDPNENAWINLAPMPRARRGAAAVAIDARHILIVGGCRNVKGEPVMLSDALLFDTETNQYQPCAPLPYAALCEQAVIDGNNVYVIGGEDKPRHRTARVVVGHLSLQP